MHRGLKWIDFFAIIYGYTKFDLKGQKMNVKDLIKGFISRGAVIYTAGSLFVLLFSLILPESSAAKVLSPAPFLYFAIYAYIISLGSTLLVSGALSAPVALLIHAACYNVGFGCFLLFCGMEFAYVAIFTALFAIVYTAAVIISKAFKGKPATKPTAKHTATAKNQPKAKKKKGKPQSTYTSRFS